MFDDQTQSAIVSPCNDTSNFASRTLAAALSVER